MEIKDIVSSREYQTVVDDYRTTCLWFAGDASAPKDRLQLEQVLSSIETYGDTAACKRVGTIREWL